MSREAFAGSSPLNVTVTASGDVHGDPDQLRGWHVVHTDVAALVPQGSPGEGCCLERAARATASPPKSSHATPKSACNTAR